ncbi:MAG: Na+/H+ antiporter NhaC [Clostridia bacterium]|nr:Na+/H+ antiporter NhaC [Clostridia bacterium]
MEKKTVSSSQALIMLLVSIVVIFSGVLLVHAPTTITLLTSGFIVIILSLCFGIKWDNIQNGILNSINAMMVPILILLAVGMLVGSWVAAGTVPYMIYLGLKVLSPGMFLFVTCLVCSIMSVMMGTSWGTISTVGIALIGVSAGLGIPLYYTAGAIVVGAIFGDKLSPLSDTTVMAAAVSEVDIVDHIKQMLYTTIPGYVLSLIIYLIIGSRYSQGVANGENVDLIMTTLSTTFNLNPILLLPPVVVLFLIFKRKPTLPVFGVGIILGCLFAVIFQGNNLSDIAGALNSGFQKSTDIAIVDKMILRGGIKSMLGTIALLIAAAVFGAPLRASGVVDILVDKIKSIASSWRSILSSTFILHGLFFIITGSYYVTFAVLGPMFKPLYDKYGLDGTNLSRSLEATGTGLAAIIPWSVTGAFISSTLGVPTVQFVLYTPMIYVAIILSFVYFITGFSIKRLPQDEVNENSTVI